MGGGGAKRFFPVRLRNGTPPVGDGDVSGVLALDDSAELKSDFSDFARSNVSRLLGEFNDPFRGDLLRGGGTGACRLPV